MSQPFPVAVIEAVLAAGVNEFVVCAGARNSALVVVLTAIEDKVRLWQHFDERAAGFFAIGRIRATATPVAVVTTSGTAVAELLPAVIEAHYQGLPLVALTADRPKSYRGSGAPQAIEQPQIFGPYATIHDVTGIRRPDGLLATHAPREQNRGVSGFHRPDDLLASWNGVKPVHVNVCLEEPERTPNTSVHALRTAAAILEPRQFLRVVCPVKSYSPLRPSAARLFMAGELLDDEVRSAKKAALESGGVIFAEAASGLREASELHGLLIRCGDATLRHLNLKTVTRCGGVPSVRFWRDLDSEMVAVASCSRSGYQGLPGSKSLRSLDELTEHSRLAPHVSTAVVMVRDAALYARLGEILTEYPASEPALFRRLSQIIPNDATVFTGNSLPIREWNLCAEYGRGHRVHVLRGANGIDGNLSAFLGIAADKAEAWCIVGDLTALYDLSAPWMLRQLPRGKRRFVVIQNGGGKIFSRLPALLELNERERALMENPHDISLRGWAEMWGMDHVSGGAELLNDSSALAALGDHAVIELYPDAGATEAFWQAWAEAELEVWA